MSEENVEQEQEKKFTQRELDDVLTKRLARAKAKHEEDQQAASTQAQQDSLAAEKKWQELAGMHEKRVKALEPLEAQVKAYTELVSGWLKDKVKALGDEAKTAIDELPESMTDLEKLNYLNKLESKGLFEVVGDGVGTPRLPKGVKKAKVPIGKMKGHRASRL